MKIDEILTDPVLFGLSLLLLLLWSVAACSERLSKKNKWTLSTTTLLRVVCGLILAGASLDKIGDAAGFVNNIRECYKFLPASLVPLAGVVIPWLEFFAGIFLLVGFRWRAAALVFSALMLIYLWAVGWDLAHGIDCNCGCFNKDSAEKMTGWTFFRDLGFLGMGSVVLLSPVTFAALDSLLNRSSKS